MKKKRSRRILTVIIIVLVLIAATVWILYRHLTGRTNYLKDSDVEVYEEAYESEGLPETVETETETERQLHPADVYDLSAVSKVTDEEAAGTFTFLIIGGEQGSAGGLENETEGEGLSETAGMPEEGLSETAGMPDDLQRPDAEAVFTMTINHNTKEVVFYTFHTDLYVEIPGFGGGRLGNAYAVGGGPLLTQTMEENYGLSINNYAMISFKDVAEIIGMPEFEELDISNDGLMVVEELVYSLGAVQPVQVAGYISKLLPYVTHNMTSEEILHMVFQIPKIIPYYGDKGKIPDEGPYTYQEMDGYIVPDAGQLAAFLKDRLYPQTESSGSENVSEAATEAG